MATTIILGHHRLELKGFAGDVVLIPVFVPFRVELYLLESELGLLACLALGRNVVLADGCIRSPDGET